MAVTFISHGYDTTSANPYTEVAWSDAHPSIGAGQYGVEGANDWKVTAVSGADRTVSIAPGLGWGYGVTDETTANETIQLDTIASGSRWDLIAVRRDWTPTAGESKFVKVNGGSVAAIPGGRLVGRGQIDDQPIALVKVTAGQTQPGPIIDIRCWAANGGMVAADDMARGYLDRLGTSVWIDDVLWRYQPGLNDVPEWKAVDSAVNGGDATPLTGLRGTWVAPFTDNRKPRVWSMDGVTAHITGLVQYKGSDKNVLTIPSPFAPVDGSITFVGAAQMSGAGSVAGGPSVHLGINGGVLQVIYQGGSLPVDGYLPLNGSWRIRG